MRSGQVLSGKESACSSEDMGSTPGLVRSPGEKMATHSSILAWRVPWTEESGRQQSMGSQRVGHNWVTNTFTFLQHCIVTKKFRQNQTGDPVPLRLDHVTILPELFFYPVQLPAFPAHQNSSIFIFWGGTELKVEQYRWLWTTRTQGADPQQSNIHL